MMNGCSEVSISVNTAQQNHSTQHVTTRQKEPSSYRALLFVLHPSSSVMTAVVWFNCHLQTAVHGCYSRQHCSRALTSV